VIRASLQTVLCNVRHLWQDRAPLSAILSYALVGDTGRFVPHGQPKGWDDAPMPTSLRLRDWRRQGKPDFFDSKYHSEDGNVP
jgi:hypothetical protein